MPRPRGAGPAGGVGTWWCGAIELVVVDDEPRAIGEASPSLPLRRSHARQRLRYGPVLPSDAGGSAAAEALPGNRAFPVFDPGMHSRLYIVSMSDPRGVDPLRPGSLARRAGVS